MVIPDSVTSIGDEAFFGCSELGSVEIGDGVTSIGNSVFFACPLKSITVDSGNEYYKSIDGNLYTKNGNTLVQYAVGKSDTSFVIPDGVTIIAPYAFFSCDSLASLVIPESVTTICDMAFTSCGTLAEVYYTGSEEKWAQIKFYGHNDSLASANIHYNYTK